MEQGLGKAWAICFSFFDIFFNLKIRDSRGVGVGVGEGGGRVGK